MRRRVVSLLVLAVLPLAACASAEPEGDGEDSAARLERLRSLPYADFADAEAGEGEDGVVRTDPDHASPGYTLYTSKTLCQAELMDTSGRIVNRWRFGPCRRWASAALLPGGDLLAVGEDLPADEGARDLLRDSYLLRATWDGRIVFKVRIGNHHDAQPIPGDRLMAITARHRIEPRFDENVMIRDDHLAVLSAGGEVLEEISLYDLLSGGAGGFELKRTGVKARGGTALVDLFHANTIAWMPYPHLTGRSPLHGPDAVMVTLRNQDAVVIIDWPARQVLWSWGPGEISGPHDASWLESGNILVFDNGLGRDRSRVVEVDPATGRIVWSFDAPDLETFYTASQGGAQRLDNGNTLITESDRGHLIEITIEGRIVWEFWNPNKNEEGRRASIFRARRYGAGSIQLGPLDAVAESLP